MACNIFRGKEVNNWEKLANKNNAGITKADLKKKCEFFRHRVWVWKMPSEMQNRWGNFQPWTRALKRSRAVQVRRRRVLIFPTKEVYLGGYLVSMTYTRTHTSTLAQSHTLSANISRQRISNICLENGRNRSKMKRGEHQAIVANCSFGTGTVNTRKW